MVRITVQKSEETKKFYDDLVEGKVSRALWGKERRFSPEAIAAKQSVFKYFTSVVARFLSKSDSVLDLGCGPGGFLSLVAPLCGQVTGADIAPNFVDECNNLIEEKHLSNASALLIRPGVLPFRSGSFDRIIVVDTVHHLENTTETFGEVSRVLKKEGLLLIFEPNKLNPALLVMCCLDRNEHGLLRLGTRKKYRELLGGRYDIVADEYNGLLIGPKSHVSLFLADVFNSSMLSPILGWLSPKIFIVARKRQSAS